MPEGPEVRKHADNIAQVLENQKLTSVWARTKDAKAWLAERENELIGKKIKSVRAHGKHLIIRVQGEYFFHSHLMMWGHWQITETAPEEIDRRERARIITKKGCAILFSAPIFGVGQGDPYALVENLSTLGPDVLPYDGEFDSVEFLHRLQSEQNASRAIGAALLDQTICAGIGNYLRADILWACKIDPWKPVADLSLDEINCLIETIPSMTRHSYLTGGTTSEQDRERIRSESTLSYNGNEWGTRHYAFRRTGLPCLRCGEKIKQLRQVTRIVEGEDGEEEKTRIMYFCAACQNVTQQPKKKSKPKKSVAAKP